MGKKMRKELVIGLTGAGLYIVLNRFTTTTPDVVLGALLGTGLYFDMIGLLPEHTYHKLKRWKTRKLSFLKI